MKQIATLLFALLIAAGASAQKIKGSRAVTIEAKEIGEFESIELADNLEVFLVKGDKCGLEIEADDNLHEAIAIELSTGILRLGLAKEVTGAKKLSVRVTYTDNLNLVVAKGNTVVTGLNDIEVKNLTIKTFESAKFLASVKTSKFVLMANDKSKTELNLTSEAATVELSKSATLKALISSAKLTFDMYQKASATIEGDVLEMKLRLDNNANFTGKNLTAKSVQISTEDYSAGSIIASEKAVIAAGGKSEIQLYGDAKIEITKFADNAILQKKPMLNKVN